MTTQIDISTIRFTAEIAVHPAPTKIESVAKDIELLRKAVQSNLKATQEKTSKIDVYTDYREALEACNRVLSSDVEDIGTIGAIQLEKSRALLSEGHLAKQPGRAQDFFVQAAESCEAGVDAINDLPLSTLDFLLKEQMVVILLLCAVLEPLEQQKVCLEKAATLCSQVIYGVNEESPHKLPNELAALFRLRYSECHNCLGFVEEKLLAKDSRFNAAKELAEEGLNLCSKDETNPLRMALKLAHFHSLHNLGLVEIFEINTGCYSSTDLSQAALEHLSAAKNECIQLYKVVEEKAGFFRPNKKKIEILYEIVKSRIPLIEHAERNVQIRQTLTLIKPCLQFFIL